MAALLDSVRIAGGHAAANPAVFHAAAGTANIPRFPSLKRCQSGGNVALPGVAVGPCIRYTGSSIFQRVGSAARIASGATATFKK